MKIAQICSEHALKCTIFVNIQKRPKNVQIAKPFYFWSTVSKKPNLADLKKAKWQPWFAIEKPILSIFSRIYSVLVLELFWLNFPIHMHAHRRCLWNCYQFQVLYIIFYIRLETYWSNIFKNITASICAVLHYKNTHKEDLFWSR